ncbi:hypothetical protein [Amorphus sp. MBR-141]
MSADEEKISLDLLRRQLQEARRAKDTLSSGGGGGTSDGMEPRIARLEKDMSEIKSDLKKIGLDVSETKGRLSAMPTTWQLAGLIIAIMGLSFVVIRFGLQGH